MKFDGTRKPKKRSFRGVGASECILASTLIKKRGCTITGIGATPIIGRYVESDPIGLEGGINPYVYVDNKPMRLFDFNGLRPPCTEECPDCPSGWWKADTFGDVTWGIVVAGKSSTREIRGHVGSSANYYWRGAWEDPRNKVYKLYLNQRAGNFP